jgi:hypothetical protein
VNGQHANNSSCPYRALAKKAIEWTRPKPPAGDDDGYIDVIADMIRGAHNYYRYKPDYVRPTIKELGKQWTSDSKTAEDAIDLLVRNSFLLSCKHAKNLPLQTDLDTGLPDTQRRLMAAESEIHQRIDTAIQLLEAIQAAATEFDAELPRLEEEQRMAAASDARRIFLIQHAIRIWTYLGNCVEEFDKGKFTYDFKRFLAELICLIDGTRDLEMPAINRLLRKFQNERYPQRAG